MSSWREILVEWCNCLHLSSKIKDVKELKNNDFFRNVLTILKKTDSTDKNDRTLFHLLNFLNETYKYAQIDDVHCNSFEELPEDRLIIITSLLMHYSCMYDGRDNFTLPLCQNLSKKIQLSIKDFLQNVNKEVAYSDLEELIGQDKIYENVESKPAQSPLTAVFRTPSLKRKFSKDKTVDKLKTALELEQYQRADIEEDLKNQIKNTQTLEKLLKKSNDEIIALKSEIFKMKCQTPPQRSKKPDSEYTIKLLKKEIENFEEYIATSDKENDKLREEHSAYRKKIDEYEAEYADLREKYLEYNEKIDELTEMLNDKCSKIVYLETYCKELNEILDGYRHKPSSAESSFCDYVPNSKSDVSIVQSENLASAVIEIQLKESQELNGELMLQVNNLTSELTSTKKYLDSKVKENEIMQSKLSRALMKLQEFKHDFQNIKKSYEFESNEYRMSLSVLKQELSKLVDSHSTSLNNLATEVLKEKDNNKSLSLQITKLELDYSQSIEEKDLCKINIENMKQEKDLLSLELEKVKSELGSSVNSYEACCMEIKTLKEIIESNKKELEILSIDNTKWENETNRLNKTLEEYCIQIENLHGTIEQNKTDLDQLISEKAQCFHDISSLKLQIDNLVTKTEDYSSKITILEDTIRDNEMKITEIISDKVELNNQINELNEIKRNLTAQLADSAVELKMLAETIKENRKEIDEMRTKNSSLNEVNMDLKDKNASLVVELEEYNAKVMVLENQIEQNMNQLRDLSKLKEDYIVKYEDLKKENCMLTTKSGEYLFQIEYLSDALKLNEKQLSEVHSENKKNIEEKDVLYEQNCALITSSKELCDKIKHNEKIISQYEKDLFELNSDNNKYIKEIEDIKREHELKIEKIKESKLTIDTLRGELELKRNEIEKLISDQTNYSNENESLKGEISSIQDMVEKYCAEIESLKSTIEQNNIEVAGLQSKSKQYQKEIEDIKREYEFKIEQIEESKLIIDKLRGELELKRNEIEELLSDQTHYLNENESLKEEISSIQDMVKKYCSEIESLKSTIEQNNIEVASLESKSEKDQKEIEDIKREYEFKIEQIEESKLTIDKLRGELELERNEIVELLSDQTHYLNENNSLKGEISSIQDMVKKYRGEIESLKTTIEQNNIEVAGLQSKSKQYQEKNKDLKQKNNSLSIKSEEYFNQMKYLESMIEQNQKVLEEKKQYISEITNGSEIMKNQWNEEKIEYSEKLKLLQESVEKNEKSIKIKETLISEQRNALSILQNKIIETQSNLKDFITYFNNEKGIMDELIANFKEINLKSVEAHGNVILELEKKLFDEQSSNNCLKSKITELENELYSEKEKNIKELRNFEAKISHDLMELRNSEKTNNEISNQMIILQESYDNLKIENDKCLQEINSQSAEIEELLLSISNWKAKCEEITSQNIHLEALLNEHKIFQKNMKHQFSNLKGFHTEEFDKYNKMIQKLQKSITIISNKLIETDEIKEKTIGELNECKKTNSDLSSNLSSLRADITKINDSWDAEKEINEKLMKDNQSLKDNYIGITKTIKLFNEELNKTIRSLKKRKSESDSKLNDLHRVYKEMNTGDLLKTPEKNKKCDEVSNEINNLGEQISKLNVYIDIFSEKETFYIKELETLKEELTASNSSRFDAIEGLKEQISENEHQISTQTENLHAIVQKYNELQRENQKYLEDIENLKEQMNNIEKRYSDEKTSKELCIKNLEEEMATLREIHNSYIEDHKEKLNIFENEKSKNNEIIKGLAEKIMYLEAQIAILKEELLQHKNNSGKTQEEYETTLANLQVQVVRSKLEITELSKKKEELVSENKNLISQLEHLTNEKEKELSSRILIEKRLAEEINSYEQLQNEKATLLNKVQCLQELQDKCQKYEDDSRHQKFLEEKQIELSQKIETLMKSIQMQKDNYEVFKMYYKQIKNEIDKLLPQKNSLEGLTNNIRNQLILFNQNILLDNPKFIDRKEALNIISEDIMKQYNRCSKQINDMVQQFVAYFEKNCDNIFASLEMKIDDFMANYNMHELGDQISDLTERAVDVLEQIKLSQREFENWSKLEQNKIDQKENVLMASKRINVDKIKEDDLKKKNLTLKQKVTLLENSKSILEKTVKKLREENKKLKENGSNTVNIDNDVHYKMLLQEYISYKEDQEKILTEYKNKIEELQNEYEDHRDNCMRSSTPIGNRFFTNNEHLEKDLEKLQDAFSKVRINNEKLDNENTYLKQIIDGHKEEMAKFTSIKEAYDKLLEENNKLMTEVDTMKYKRARDRDEFLRWLKKERTENDAKHSKQIQNIKAEYEMKLEKMKDKMIKLYREEVNKEMSKIKGRQHESNSLLKTVERLECDLFEAKQKIQLLNEREMRKMQDHNAIPQIHGSNSQLNETDNFSLKDFPASCMNSTAIDSKPRTSISKFMEFKHPNKVNPSSLDTRKQYEERQVRTLPRSGTIVEEVCIRRTSFGVPNSMGNLQMEDEDEMFNNKYLTDLKQGKCDLPSSSEEKDSRVSELAWRNSLVPPHLKSSYPAETQFCTPDRFREDDIKTGTGAFDDSLCKLLPNEKRKKDFGTTSYKKPGPPTPSKNGGRLSLTGSEMHVSKDQQSETKKSTPGRIRSLFTGKNSSRSSIEPGASPKKRYSIFRR